MIWVRRVAQAWAYVGLSRWKNAEYGLKKAWRVIRRMAVRQAGSHLLHQRSQEGGSRKRETEESVRLRLSLDIVPPSLRSLKWISEVIVCGLCHLRVGRVSQLQLRSSGKRHCSVLSDGCRGSHEKDEVVNRCWVRIEVCRKVLVEIALGLACWGNQDAKVCIEGSAREL